MQGHVAGYHQDLHNILFQGSPQDLSQDMGSPNRDGRDQERDNRFVRDCAVEMHMDIAQKQFYAIGSHLQQKKPGIRKHNP